MRIMIAILATGLSVCAFADVRVIKKEDLRAKTELDGSSASAFCVRSIDPNPIFEVVATSSNRRHYTCEVDFVGQADGRRINGKRILSYRMTTDVIKRKNLRKQDDTLSSMETAEHKKGFYLLPKAVYRLLPNISVAAEEEKIQNEEYALIPTEHSLDRAARASCYVGLLESLDSACGPADLDHIRHVVQEKLNTLETFSKEAP